MAVIPTLDDLDVSSVRLFLAVIELGSVSKAATRFGVTQPSATARLQRLEAQLGLRLLERGPTGSQVTADGIQVAGWCAGLVSAAGALSEGARAIRTESDVRLRIAATSTIARHHLPAWVADRPLPGVQTVLTELPTADIAHALRAGEVDLGMLDGPGAPLSLRSEIVDWIELLVVVAPSHPWAGLRRGVTGAQLTASKLILRAPGSGTRDVIEAALAEHELGGPGSAIEVATTSAARLAAVNQSGAAILPALDVAADLTSGRLVAVSVRDVDLRQPIRVAWKGQAPAHPAARRLLESLRELPS